MGSRGVEGGGGEGRGEKREKSKKKKGIGCCWLERNVFERSEWDLFVA